MRFFKNYIHSSFFNIPSDLIAFFPHQNYTEYNIT